MSDIIKIKASKEKCRRHRDNWKREAIRLRGIIDSLGCMCEYNHLGILMVRCQGCYAKQQAKEKV